ncbi:MAG TPA: hypothetical protein PKC20_04930 [Burkholderiaceae bacterium]|nr:hypothetical protein [Burkholderiaceae bacterium]
MPPAGTRRTGRPSVGSAHRIPTIAQIGEMVGRVKRVADLIGEIGESTRAQTVGIQEVGQAVVELDDTTQRNAALAEQSAAAAESLRGQAPRLNALVRVFRLEA